MVDSTEEEIPTCTTRPIGRLVNLIFKIPLEKHPLQLPTPSRRTNDSFLWFIFFLEQRMNEQAMP